MHKFYFKPTKILGIVEVGELDPDAITILKGSLNSDRGSFDIDAYQFKALAEMLNIKISFQASWKNPQLVSATTYQWHNDVDLPQESLLFCLGTDYPEDGTIFKDSTGETFQVEPWKLYWIREVSAKGTLLHKGVFTKRDRFMYRFCCVDEESNNGLCN